ncbi:MAG: hypothetical protein WC934_13030 [Acidithiobacillus sp.]|jgi:hypothetical protein|uniref:hypothetical protein n=1 Tax=Acidithiobacillus sp. TaxID=1872118 RepID=UPI00355F0918
MPREFDNSKDQLIKSWDIKINENTKLVVSIHRYNNGDPKVQIGPMMYLKDDQTWSFGKLKRLGWSEMNLLQEIMDDILSEMDSIHAKMKNSARRSKD